MSNCAHTRTKVIDSRLSDLPHVIKRRRHECRDCGARFTTVEIPLEQYELIANSVRILNRLTESW